MNTLKLLLLTGKSGSGKTTVSNLLVKNSFANRLITRTTRAAREGEIIHGDDRAYSFLTTEKYETDKALGVIFEESYDSYSKNHYWTTTEDLYACAINDEVRFTIAVVDADGFMNFPDIIKKFNESQDRINIRFIRIMLDTNNIVIRKRLSKTKTNEERIKRTFDSEVAYGTMKICSDFIIDNNEPELMTVQKIMQHIDYIGW